MLVWSECLVIRQAYLYSVIMGPLHGEVSMLTLVCSAVFRSSMTAVPFCAGFSF